MGYLVINVPYKLTVCWQLCL